MPSTLADRVVPARFLLTLGNMFVTLLAFFHRDRNVRAGLAQSATEEDVAAANAELTFVLVLSFISVFVSLVNLLGGCSGFSIRVGALQVVAQFASAVATSVFVVDGVHYVAYWYIFVLANLAPLVVEVVVLLQVFVLQVKPWHRKL